MRKLEQGKEELEKWIIKNSTHFYPKFVTPSVRFSNDRDLWRIFVWVSEYLIPFSAKQEIQKCLQISNLRSRPPESINEPVYCYFPRVHSISETHFRQNFIQKHQVW